MNKKVVFITGASGGIGRSTALKLADEGYTVVAAGRSEKELAKLVADRSVIDSCTLEAIAGSDLKYSPEKLFDFFLLR